MALRKRARISFLSGPVAALVAASLLVVPPGPAAAAAAGAAASPQVPEPAQPGSPNSARGSALSTSSVPVTTMTGPISVPVGTGPVRNGSFTTFALTDRLTLDVNTGSGNLMLRSTDLVLPGIAGNLTWGAAYNSLLTGSGLPKGSFNWNWRTRAGVDVKLIKADDNSVTYVAADGVVGRFTPSGSGYTTPKEFKATLANDGSGWKLTEHESGRELYFTSGGLLDRTLDRNDNVTDFAYDGNGRLTTVTSDRGSSGARSATISYGSDGISALAQTVSGGSRGVSYTYDGSGNLAKIATNGGNETRFEYDSSHRITKIVSGVGPIDVGAITLVTYDSSHRVTSVKRVLDSANPSVGAVTRWAYPSATQTLVADANTDQAQPVTSVPRSTFTVNSDKRVTEAVDPAGKTRKTSYTPFFDVATATNGTGGITTNTYGANGQQSMTSSAAPAGATATYTYANAATPTNPTAAYQPSSGKDTQGNNSTFTYNGAGNRISAKDALAAEAKVDYNSDGTVKTSTDPGNGTNSTTYAYNSDKQLTTVTPPTGTSLGNRTFTYDAYGRVRTATDGAGKTSTYDYDAQDRVKTISYSDGTTAVTYDYDPAGNVRARADATGSQGYVYDRLNRMIGRQASQGYVYDPVGNLKQVQDQRGTSVYEYDTRNLLKKLTAANGVYTFDYDDEGRRTATRLTVASAQVAETVNTFDQSGRITRTTSKRWQSGTASTVFDVSYCYAKRVSSNPCSTNKLDDTGLRQWHTDHHRSGAVSVYTYDNSNRLTKATNVAGSTYEYGYDSRGNRTSEKTNDIPAGGIPGYNAANQMTGTQFPGPFYYSYDGAGNLTTGSSRKASYNAAKQMTSRSKTDDTEQVTYKYAGPDQNELGYRTTATFESRYFYGLKDDNGLPMLQSYTVPSSYAKHYLERDQRGTPLGIRAETNGTSHHYFYVLDGLGSVVALIKHDGTLAGTYTYDPYGKTVSTTGAGEEIQENAIGYAGGLRADGLVKFGQRWYDPVRGRFTQQDNLSFVGDPAKGNRYAYAACNPTNYVDPTGLDDDPILDAIDTGGKFAAGTAAVAGLAGCAVGAFAAGVGCLAAGGFMTLFGAGFGFIFGVMYSIGKG
ncbi:RHS repeat-associated core domain-containing protein [Asanoa sp. WMMD1127]|uniref:RHS repeat-associated core domain-containing protein n=1 Tax=Asanoa sp. WMMD1127 TaxID=3016107 RepID=UPI00241794CE|nr:RHS repeat-associated core domain-containing protein [Asanoa sp. WMMD1127]MDG4823232.1 RHS repeat-associated core domain-containing protein [Asanoa sp. WMMD1127]